MELTLQDLFGARASQDEQFLKINKVDLAHLSATNDNRAEQLLVALILKAQQQFEGVVVDETGQPIADETLSTISYNNSSLYSNLLVSFWRIRFQDLKKIHQFVIQTNEKT
jgi:hypothetical protein